MLLKFLSSLFLCFVISVASDSDYRKVTKISPEIVNELKDFTHLIPQATIDEIVAKHYIIDGNFREVIKYLRSSEFTQLLQRVQQLPEAIEILQFLHLLVESDNETCQSTSSSEHCHVTEAPPVEVEIVLIDEEPTQHAAVGTFSSFVEELMQHLPRSEYVNLITEKRAKSAAFDQFYTALRSAQLRPMIDAALKTANVIEVLKPLKSNGIDVKSLEATVFKVISWGPAV